MTKQIGLVTRICTKGLTEVLTERTSACGGCQTTHGCKSCLTSKKIKAKVNNPIGARPGDLVEIHLAQSAVVQSAVILYGLPLSGLIIGAFAGVGLGLNWFADESAAAVVCGVVGLVLGLVMAVLLGNSAYAQKHLIPTIVRVIAPGVPAALKVSGS